MRLKLLFTIFAMLLTACIPTFISIMPTVAPTDSGIYGQVTIGPTCPVQQVNNPCPDKPYQATLTILTTTTKSKVLQFTTDENGNFRVALAPGEYILHPESPGFLPRGRDQNFTVPLHEFVQLNVSYDSGIR